PGARSRRGRLRARAAGRGWHIPGAIRQKERCSAARSPPPFNHTSTRQWVHTKGTRRDPSESVAGNDRGLDVGVAVKHVAQHMLKARTRRLARNVIGAPDLLFRNQSERLAHALRSVVEGGLERDLGIMQPVGIQVDLGSRGAPAEEVDGAAFAHHVDGPLPGFRAADGLDDHVGATALRRKRAHRLDGVLYLRDLHHFIRAQAFGCRDLRLTLNHGDNIATREFRHLHEHQADGPAADYYHGVPDLHTGLVQAAQHAGQRFDHRRFLIADAGRNRQHIGFNDPSWNLYVLGVCAVVEQQVLAKVLLMLGAVETHLARSRIESHHPHAFLEVLHSRCYFFDDARQLVAEQRGRDDHARVISALVNLQVGAAGERNLYLDQHLAGIHPRDGHSFNLHVLLAIEDGCCHLSVHARLSFRTQPEAHTQSPATTIQRYQPTNPYSTKWEPQGRFKGLSNRSPGLCRTGGSGLNDQLHGIRLRAGSKIQRRDSLGQGKAVADQALQIHLLAAHKAHRVLLQVHRRTVRTYESLFVHTNRGGIDDGLSSNRLRKEHYPTAGTRRVHCGADKPGSSRSQNHYIGATAFCERPRLLDRIHTGRLDASR